MLLEQPTSWLGLHSVHRRKHNVFDAETCAPSSKSATRNRDARSTSKAKHAKRRKSRKRSDFARGAHVVLVAGDGARALLPFYAKKVANVHTDNSGSRCPDSRNMLHASIGQSYPAQSIPSEKAHQLPSCTFSLPKSQQRNGTQLRIRPASRWQAQAGRSRLATFTRAESKSSATAPWVKADARLVLADGSVWRGRAFGATDTEIGEVVFNTSITGYEEIMTDPSYRGQFVVFTHPHIGNVGINIGKLPS